MELNIVVSQTEPNECNNPNWQADKTVSCRSDEFWYIQNVFYNTFFNESDYSII